MGKYSSGKLLFDYHAMPFTRMPLLEVPGEELVLVREGYSEGGENPNGWSAKAMPYLMEYDNWGGLVVDDRKKIPREELAWRDWWGYDQIAWFANQPEESRNISWSTPTNGQISTIQMPTLNCLSAG